MRTFFECIPCLVRQALDSVRRATDDEQVHERVLRETLQAISETDLRHSPPAMAYRIHRLIREMTGGCDPYREMKDKSNQLALGLYPGLKFRVDRADEPLEISVRLAIAGNAINVAVNSEVDELLMREEIDHALKKPLDGDINEFYSAVMAADRVLYLTDNAGEIVFDRLLLEQLPLDKVTVAVRGAPVLNDATIEDARAVGITDLVEVIDNGSDAPGTILEKCSESFRERFDKADLIIAKGQGNYETLSEVDKNILFLLKAKCPLIARHIGCKVGSLIIRRSNRVATEAKEGGLLARI